MRDFLEEIREICEKIYEETKNMTDEEKEKYLRQGADRVLDQTEPDKTTKRSRTGRLINKPALI